MMTSNLIRVTTLAAVIAGLAGTARADTFVSIASGDWSDYTNVWLQNSFPAARAPDVGDDVTIQDNHTVDMDDDFGATALTIEGRGVLNVNVDLSYPYTRYTLTLPSGGSADIFGKLDVNGILDVNNAAVTVEASAEVDIENGAALTVHGTSPSITVANTGLFKMFNGATSTVAGATTFTIVNGGSFLVQNGADITLVGAAPSLTLSGAMTVYGSLSLDASSGTPFLDIQTSQIIPATSGGNIGAIIGVVHSGGNQPEIRLNYGVTMTNAGVVAGDLKIMGTSSNVGTFTNGTGSVVGKVSANAAATLLLDSTLAAIGDTTNGVWSAETSSSAELRFAEGSNGLLGSFRLLHTGSTIRFFAVSIGTPSFVCNAGTIIVDFGQQFCFGTVTGTSGSKPASNGCLNAGTFNY